MADSLGFKKRWNNIQHTKALEVERERTMKNLVKNSNKMQRKLRQLEQSKYEKKLTNLQFHKAATSFSMSRPSSAASEYAYKSLENSGIRIRKCWAGEPEAINSVRRKLKTPDERNLEKFLQQAEKDVLEEEKEKKEEEYHRFIPPYPVHFRSSKKERVPKSTAEVKSEEIDFGKQLVIERPISGSYQTAK
ncbi:DgyrCDS8568 [Dimorphilus gyrociliatus]|uniref:DgyrCDS8568 n=1 Tax=Dimorphilus gyrociliatus TaxID=2664684 RepID=A0A7I8VWU5_9ANNE|nr:DgyrCDS8568 [Dimorphilus gyrociliatus]